MEDLPINEKLYMLQLQLKRNRETKEQKKIELEEILGSYESQIRTLIYQLYKTANLIWAQVNSKAALMNGALFAEKKEPEFQKSADYNNITRKLNMIRENPKVFSDLTRDGYEFQKNDFMFILSVFNFCWSKESIDQFLDFISNLNDELKAKMSLCFLVSPCVQIFFISALKPIFETLNNGVGCAEVLESLKKYSALIPDYLKTYINNFRNKSKFFYNSFLKLIIDNFVVFGISEPELYLYSKDKLEELKNELENYFGSENSNEFIESLLSSSSICVIPKESKLIDIHPKYYPTTLVDSDTFSKYGINTDSGKLFFVPTVTILPSSNYSEPTTNKNSLSYYTRQFLMEAEIIQIETDSNSPIEWFQNLTDLSSFSVNSKLESIFGHLIEYLNDNTTMDTIYKIVENELIIENKSQSEDPLKDISSYCSQLSYLNKILELEKSISNYSSNFLNFITIDNVIKNFFSTNIPPKDILESNVFIDYFQKALNYLNNTVPSLENDVITNRNLHSLLTQKCDIINWLNEDHEIKEEEEKLHKFLSEKKNLLIEYHQFSFLEIYKKEPEKLKFFFEEFNKAFNCNMLFVRISHIHSAYEILSGLLQIQGMNEIGADQIVPFAILATVYANPKGLSSTYTFLLRYVEPLISSNSVIYHSQEYSLIQFLSTYQFLHTKMKEFEEGVFPQK